MSTAVTSVDLVLKCSSIAESVDHPAIHMIRSAPLLFAIIMTAACSQPGRPVIVRHAVRQDVSAALSTLVVSVSGGACQRCPPNALAPEVAGAQQGGGSPAFAPRDATGALVEQRAQGSRPPPELVVSFDGLGFGLDGPQGPSNGRNPSDNSLAVGPDHVIQTVNSRLAIFDKRGTVLYGSVPTNTLFAGFGGTCELRTTAMAWCATTSLQDAGSW
jgi:hypothetical protein